MNSHILTAIGAISLIAPVSVGFAGVVPLGTPTAHSLNQIADWTPPGGGGGGFGERTPGSRGVALNDVASMSIQMTALNGAQANMNGGGQVLVTRGLAFTDIGIHRSSPARVLASWDEVVSAGRTFISVIFKTDNGSHLVPVTSNIDGVGIFSWNWDFGTVDPVDYSPGVSAVSLLSARAYFSRNGGTSFFANTNIAPGLPSSFMPGVDSGTPLLTAGDGTNYVLIRYEIDVTIPTPATAFALVSGISMIGLRRRR